MKDIKNSKAFKFVTENWIGGVIGAIGAPMLAVLAMGPFKAFMMSFTVGGITVSGLGYLVGALIQKYFFK